MFLSRTDGRFTGKAALATGAASGIGRATALAFAREGTAVAVADVAKDDNDAAARMINDQGGRALAVTCAAFTIGHALVVDGGQTA